MFSSIILFSICILASFQFTAKADELTLIAETDKDEYTSGEIIAFNFRFYGADEIRTNSLGIEIGYDEDRFELAYGNAMQSIENGYIPFNIKSNREDSMGKYIGMYYVSTSDGIRIKNGSKVATIYFKVKETADTGLSEFIIRPVSMLDASFETYHVNNNEEVLITIYISNDEKLAILAGEAINLGNVNGIVSDIALITEGEYGTTISWESDKPHIISNIGRVIRPIDDELVELTATITKGEVIITKKFKIVVKAVKLMAVQRIRFENNFGDTVSSLQPFQTVNIKTSVENFSDKAHNLILIAVLYGPSGEVLNISRDEKEFYIGDEDNLEVSLEMPKIIDGCKVKAFIWNSFQGMRPVTNKEILTD